MKIEELVQIIKEEVSKNLKENEEGEIATTYKSDSFSLKDLKVSDPELATAIKSLSGKNLKKSNLLFDGKALHWRLGSTTVFSWRASSGHYEDNPINPGAPPQHSEKTKIAIAKDFTDIIEILNNSTESTSLNQKVRDIWKVFSRDGKTGPNAKTIRKGIDGIIQAWRTREELDTAYQGETSPNTPGTPQDPTPALKADFVEKYREAGMKLKDIIMDNLADKYSELYKTSPEQRKAQATDPKTGPIPEGKYLIQHALQDISNITKASLQDFFEAALAVQSEEDKDRIADKYPRFLQDLRLGNPMRGDDDSNQSWGNFRVRISKLPRRAQRAIKLGPGYKERGTKGAFYIHGGLFRGSSGCIDLGSKIDSFAKFWTLGGIGKMMKTRAAHGSKSIVKAKAQLPKADPSLVDGSFIIPLFVDYTPAAKKELLTKNPIAKENEDLVFQP
jgi:hypothetical protein